MNWACDRRNGSTTRRRPARLPSPATVRRRRRRTSFACFLTVLADRLRGTASAGWVLARDGKPPLVGGNSHDPDARSGRAAGHVGRGDKWHAIWGQRPAPEAWEVTPLNTHEVVVAERLAGQLTGGGYVVADGNSDANRRYDRRADRADPLVAAQREANPGTGHHLQSPARLRAIALWGSAFGQALDRCRAGIERAFGNATAFAGGRRPLPAWVRRSWRVEQWVWAKIVIHAARIRDRQRLAATMQ